MSQVIDIVSLYPKDMNIYGDSGNVLTIQRRLALYGYEPRVHAYNQGCDWPGHVDMILGGGGQDIRHIPDRRSCVTACSRSAPSNRTAPATTARTIRKARASTT